jgi:hypothetical protein
MTSSGSEIRRIGGGEEEETMYSVLDYLKRYLPRGDTLPYPPLHASYQKNGHQLSVDNCV